MKKNRGPASLNMWPAVITGAAALIASLVLAGCAQNDTGENDIKTDSVVNSEESSVEDAQATPEISAADVSIAAEEPEAGKDKTEDVATTEISFEKVDPSEISAESPFAKQEGALPAYEYPGPELFYSVVYDYIVKEFGSAYLQGDVTIPCPIIVAVDESDRSDIRVYADFEVYNYTLGTDGETLMTISGGRHPGCLHVASTDAGYEIVSFDAVEDGSNYDPSAKEIFGEYYDEFQKVNSDDKLRDETRAQIIANYAAANNLNISGYQDYGWEKRALPTENIDSFYSALD